MRMEARNSGSLMGGRTGSRDQAGPAVKWYLYLSLFFLLTCINALIAKFVVFSFPVAPGASLFYVVVAFMIAFTLWFGVYGALAAYTGCYIGAGLLSGIPPDVALYWSFADFFEVLIPLAAFRVWGCDPALRSWRDVLVLVVFGVVINNVVGSAWGSATLAAGGIIPWSSFGETGIAWLTTNLIICIVLMPPLLRFVTPLLEGHELYVNDWWH